jgi:hypothetical protein
MKQVKVKRLDYRLEARTFKGRTATYMVFRAPRGSFHAFVETEAKAAARDCGETGGNTRRMWGRLWSRKSN